MKITFEMADREQVEKLLDAAGVSASDINVDIVLESIAAAFVQQFTEEAEHMINNLDEETL